MPQSTVPQDVVDKDHELDGRTLRASEALAKHRWQQILDPAGPRYGIRVYARAVGRNEQTISRFAKGYALYLERQGDASRGNTLTVLDAIELGRQSADQQALTEAIAEGSGETVQRVAHPGRRHERAAIVGQAQDRAERRGTDPVDEAREIAERQRKTREMGARHREERAERHTMRYVEVEGKLVTAKRALLAAIQAASNVDFDDEEVGLMRHSLADVQSVLNLLDTRLAGPVDVDWDAELARLGDES